MRGHQVKGLGMASEEGDGRARYYARAQGWAQDREGARRRSARAAWIVAGVAATLAGLEALALVALAPLKTVVPYTLLVDRNTGFAQALEGTGLAAIRPDAALTQALLAQYVIARESFDIATIAEQYRKVALWSAEGARADYLAQMPAANPASPLARLGRGAVLSVRVESVSMIAADTALVRFANDLALPGRPRGATAYWVAVVRYRFAGAPMAVEDRLVNPLGFAVTSYRRDAEAPPVAEPPAPVATATAAVVAAPVPAPAVAAMPVQPPSPAAPAAPAAVMPQAGGGLSPGLARRRYPWAGHGAGGRIPEAGQ
ncbi:MAG TPA: type IV secretion system protein [Novosphingobium sp.]|nr:type IV secretion system protein [Novosphingobium sp.]HZV09187.1 type IV secretion system protein [Novosphingobium sp.]